MEPIKFVIGNGWGNLCLSQQAIEIINYRKSQQGLPPIDSAFGDVYNDEIPLARSDPDLVHTIETLGSEVASGNFVGKSVGLRIVALDNEFKDFVSIHFSEHYEYIQINFDKYKISKIKRINEDMSINPDEKRRLISEVCVAVYDNVFAHYSESKPIGH